MARLPFVKPTKSNEEEPRAETEVNQDDLNAENPINPLDSSTDWVQEESGKDDDNEFVKPDEKGTEIVQDDDEEDEGVNGISDESRSTTEDDFLMNGDSKPIGVLLSVKRKQVIVKGKEKDNYKLVKKGSFMWLPETREPLGFVDEISGTLEEPCYTVKLKSKRKLFGIMCDQGNTPVSLIVSGSLQHDKKVCDEYISSSDDDDDDEEREKKVSFLGNSATRRVMYSREDFEGDREVQEYMDRRQRLGLATNMQQPNLDAEEWPDLASQPEEAPSTRSQSLHNRGFGRGHCHQFPPR